MVSPMTSVRSGLEAGAPAKAPLDSQNEYGGTRQRGAFTVVVLLLGVALRIWNYAGNAALSLDEILVGRNILELPMRVLVTEPLRLDQVAPRGFLFIEKLAVLALGENELALRLFPLLCSIAGLLLFARLASRTLVGVGAPFAVMLYAIGLPFIFYGAVVKQYGIDATATIVLLLLVLDLRERDFSTRRLILHGAVGFAIVWFSQASVFVMTGIGIAIGVEWLLTRERRLGRVLLIAMPVWAIAAAAAVVVGLHSMTPGTREFMDDFWGQGFFPWPLHGMADLEWFWSRGISVFTSPNLLRYELPAVCLIVSLLGAAALWRRRRDVALVLTGPVVVTLAAAIAHQYPFRDRLVLFLMPCVLLALAAGAESIREMASRLHPALGGSLVVALAVPPVLAVARNPLPYETERIRDVLTYLQHHRRPGDVVYSFPLTRISLLYYGERYGLPRDSWMTGVCDRNDTRAFIRDVDRFRGAPRVWVIPAGHRPFRNARVAVQQYLGTIGVKRDSLVAASFTLGRAGIDLYDLSDTVRLRKADAGSFPVPPAPTDPRPGCRDWARAGGAADSTLR
jgi:hypothetical protein